MTQDSLEQIYKRNQELIEEEVNACKNVQFSTECSIEMYEHGVRRELKNNEGKKYPELKESNGWSLSDTSDESREPDSKEC